jgi:hypothetical protein
VSVYVRPHGSRWQVVSSHDDRLAVLMESTARFRAVEYAARLLDVPTSEVDVRA